MEQAASGSTIQSQRLPEAANSIRCISSSVEEVSANAAIEVSINEVDAISRETAAGVEASKESSAALAAMARELKALAKTGNSGTP